MPSMAVGLARSSHPGPSVAISIVAALLGTGIGLDGVRIFCLGFAMLVGQLSVGLSNDWLDAPRDRATGRADKPVARGLIGVTTVRNAAWVCAALMVVVSIPLGWGAQIALTVCIGLAWAYNLGLKRSWIATALYIVSFGLLPLIATLSLPHPRAASAWSIGVAGLFGVAGQFSNALPDLDADLANRVRSIPQRIGPERSKVVTYTALLLASGVEFVGTGLWAFIPGVISLALSAIATVVGIFVIVGSSRWHFRIILGMALVDVGALVAAGSRVIA